MGIMLYYAEHGIVEDKGWERKNDNNQILKFFLCIPAYAADAPAVNPKGVKTLLANGLITFFLSLVILILVTDQEAYQEILLIVPS